MAPRIPQSACFDSQNLELAWVVTSPHNPISTGPLATVQPAVRNPEQTFGFPAMIWPLGNPEGGGYPDTGITIGQIAFSNPLAQLIHQDKRIRRLHIPQNQAELLATEAAPKSVLLRRSVRHRLMFLRT